MTIQLLFFITLFAIAHGVIRKIDTQIMGGKFVKKPGEVPYQVSLQRTTTLEHFCGGVIISRHYILTAASCVNGVDVNTISVNVGLIDVEEPYAIHLVESSHIHEDYDRTKSINDIALLKLQYPLKYSPLVRAALLTPNKTIPAGTKVVASGFGRLWFEGPKTIRLHVVDIEIVNQDTCRNLYRNWKNISDTQICAHGTKEEKGSCEGDTGGPLILNEVLIGIDSWRYRCGDMIYPALYTHVPSYFQWIIDNTECHIPVCFE
ncbi:chymotrypsin-2-like isoform X2 [Temnothorax longispinosus]|uniref:chymotrypsin-2-like isoform X2 n=1 Tax=Temnothorax longispinosus TaxID=300112 RepID=UPI003A9976BC